MLGGLDSNRASASVTSVLLGDIESFSDPIKHRESYFGMIDYDINWIEAR